MMELMPKDSKRQVLPSGLWVVATPIGNLSDLSDRAQQALSEAESILCEDTRQTRVLLSALQIEGKKLHRFDAYATSAELTKWVELLQSGARIALVTDAGT